MTTISGDADTTWGTPSPSTFYDGVSFSKWSTDVSVAYVAPDFFMVTALVDGTDQEARGAAWTWTTDGGVTWGVPRWLHRGCTNWWSEKPAVFFNPQIRYNPTQIPWSSAQNPYVWLKAGHYGCDNDDPTPPPVNYQTENIEWVKVNLTTPTGPTSSYGILPWGSTSEKYDMRYTNFEVISFDQAGSPAFQFIEVGLLDQSWTSGYVPSPNPLDDPCGTTVKVDWVVQRAMGLGSVWSSGGLYGPVFDTDSTSPLCVGSTRRMSWLPGLALSADNKALVVAIPITNGPDLRIHVTELYPDASYPAAANPSAGGIGDTKWANVDSTHNSFQIWPSVAFSNISTTSSPLYSLAVTWVDDRQGGSPGAFGGVFGMSSGGTGENVVNLGSVQPVMPFSAFYTT